LVPDQGGCETSIGGGVPAYIDASRSHIDDMLKHLGLSQARIAYHQEVDVWPDGWLTLFFIHFLILIPIFLISAEHEVCEVSFVLKPVVSPAKEAQDEASLHQLMPEDGRTDRFYQQGEEVLPFRDLVDHIQLGKVHFVVIERRTRVTCLVGDSLSQKVLSVGVSDRIHINVGGMEGLVLVEFLATVALHVVLELSLHDPTDRHYISTDASIYQVVLDLTINCLR